MAVTPYRFLGINLVDKWISLRRIAGIIEPQYFPQMAALVLGLFTNPIPRKSNRWISTIPDGDQ
jgi:hypothetical protein